MGQCKHGYYEVLCTQCDEEEVAAYEKAITSAGWRSCIDHIIKPDSPCPVCRIAELEALLKIEEVEVELLRERAEDAEAQQWIPVSEPPVTDIGTGMYGTATILVYDGDSVFEAEYHEGNTVYRWGNFNVEDGITVTHWMPLPQPPEGTNNESH